MTRATTDSSFPIPPRLGLGSVIASIVLEYSADEMLLGSLARYLSSIKLKKLLKVTIVQNKLRSLIILCSGALGAPS